MSLLYSSTIKVGWGWGIKIKKEEKYLRIIILFYD